MWKAFKGWFSALSLLGKTLIIGVASVTALGTVGAIGSPPTNKPTPKTTPVVKAAIHKIEKTTVSIPFDTSNVDDSTLASGTAVTKAEGVDGTKTQTWDVAIIDGVETNKTLIKEEVTAPPVTKIIAHGTYVAPVTPTCSNGSYTNVDGVEVCNPSPTNTGGATAICEDGSYSYSLYHSGTCSHHGGVAEWL